MTTNTLYVAKDSLRWRTGEWQNWQYLHIVIIIIIINVIIINIILQVCLILGRMLASQTCSHIFWVLTSLYLLSY